MWTERWLGCFFLDNGIFKSGINSLIAFTKNTSRVFTWSQVLITTLSSSDTTERLWNEGVIWQQEDSEAVKLNLILSSQGMFKLFLSLTLPGSKELRYLKEKHPNNEWWQLLSPNNIIPASKDNQFTEHLCIKKSTWLQAPEIPL